MADGAEAPTRPSADAVRAWSGHRLDEIAGGRVGKVERVLLGEHSGEPEWLLARMGRFGHHTLIPVRDAVEGVGSVWVPYTRDQIRRAPKVEPDDVRTAASERALLDHYGITARPG